MKHTSLWLLFILASLSFIPTLTLQYIGEEAVYTISSLEMSYYQEMFRPMLFSNFYQRPPMLNWVMMVLANGIGWDHILLASRLITAFATVLTALLLVGFTQYLCKNRLLAIFTGLCFFSFDILFRRGWLAYADALFALFTFTAIVCLWIALDQKQRKYWLSLLFIAMLSLAAAFLTKALTAYVFYGITALVLLIRHPHARAILLKPDVIMIHLLGFSFPLVWNFYIVQGAHGEGMLTDIFAKFESWNGFGRYLIGLIKHPTEIILRLAPATLIALYLLLRKRVQLPKENHSLVITLLWIVGISYLPYGIAPYGERFAYSMRYVLPLYPFIAIITAYTIWFSASRYFKFSVLCITVLILLKYIVGIWGFPYYERTYRGNYEQIAKDVMTRTQGYSLYPDTGVAIELSVIANIDTLRFPQQPISAPAANWQSGFILTSRFEPSSDRLIKEYKLGSERLYLLCRGNAC